MKKNLFHKVTTKATALVMGSLMVFAGQAFAISSNYQEFTITDDTLGNSKSIIAQDLKLAIGVATAVQALDKVITTVKTKVVTKQLPNDLSPEVRDQVLAKFAEAQQALSTAQASAKKNDTSAVATAVGIAVSSLNNSAQALASADAGTAKALVNATTNFEKAVAKAVAEGSSSPQQLKISWAQTRSGCVAKTADALAKVAFVLTALSHRHPIHEFQVAIQ